MTAVRVPSGLLGNGTYWWRVQVSDPANNLTQTATTDGQGNFKVEGLTPGTYTVVLRATAAYPFSKDPAAKQKPNVNVVLPATPLTFTVLPKPAKK